MEKPQLSHRLPRHKESQILHFLPFAPTLHSAESYVQENRVLMEGETADVQGVAAWNEMDCAFKNRGGVCR